MALKLKCPCGERLTAPEAAAGLTGLSDDLPDLNNNFGDLLDEALSEPQPAVQVPMEPAPTTSDAVRKSSNRNRSSGARLAGLSSGIKLVFWGTLLVVGSVFVGFVAPFTAPALFAVALWVGILGALLSTAGRIVCLSAPQNVGGKGLLLTAVVCDLVYMAISLSGTDFLPAAIVGIVANILWLATLILFVLFLRAVGESIGQEHLANEGNTVMVTVAMCIVLFLGLIIPFVNIFCLLALLVCTVVAVVKYVKLLHFAVECVDYARG